MNMSMIGKSGADWSIAPEGATHYRENNNSFYRYSDGWEYYDRYGKEWVESCTGKGYLQAHVISKEEDLKMNKEAVKQVSCVADLETGMFVFMQDGYSAYVNKDDSGNVGFLYTHGHTDMNYLMSMNYRGLEYKPNPDVNITHWGYSLNGERYPVAQSQTDAKIKELEDTIAQASQQLKELKELQK